jgi:hypothetical protein
MQHDIRARIALPAGLGLVEQYPCHHGASGLNSTCMLTAHDWSYYIAGAAAPSGLIAAEKAALGITADAARCVRRHLCWHMQIALCHMVWCILADVHMHAAWIPSCTPCDSMPHVCMLHASCRALPVSIAASQVRRDPDHCMPAVCVCWLEYAWDPKPRASST